MDFNQTKLTRYEWETMEKKLEPAELTILKMIRNGYHDTECFASTKFTTRDVMKMEHEDKDYFIYDHFFKEPLATLCKSLELKPIVSKAPKKPLKTADKIRLQSQKSQFSDTVEFMVLHYLSRFSKSKKSRELYFYNIEYLSKHYELNAYVKGMVVQFVARYEQEMDLVKGLENASLLLENNEVLTYRPITLHSHQKQIYQVMKEPGPKLIYYRAPTSSGKTLTPIGITQEYKVIFLCASRHIGLNLAKSSVNTGVKVAFAFGCKTADDIRLHYSAVRTFTEKNGRKRPVHSDGRNIDMIFCDIQSYEVTMLFMLSLFEKEKMVLFWDEPTITMDYETHPLHDLIKEVWKVNQVPNIVLSSATLPNEQDLVVLSDKYLKRYEGKVHYIESVDETTQINLLDKEGCTIMPHTVFAESQEELISFMVLHKKSHLKFLSVQSCADFIRTFMEKDKDYALLFKLLFTRLSDMTSYSIRMFYCSLVQEIKNWPEEMAAYERKSLFVISDKIVTETSHTLTYGPTIFLCERPVDWMNYFVEFSGIHASTMQDIEKKMEFNQDLSEKMIKIQKQIEDQTSKDEDNENKVKEQRFDVQTKTLIKEYEVLERRMKAIRLDPVYIPNTREHFAKWTNGLDYDTSCVFVSDIDDLVIQRVMKMEVDLQYKILLLLGIGIFNPVSNEYNELITELSEQKRLGVILANSDYIYGTNYQFCHAYIANDLKNMTQEKIIQAIGRVGRKEKNKRFTFRFQDNSLIPVLYSNGNPMEKNKLNELFL